MFPSPLYTHTHTHAPNISMFPSPLYTHTHTHTHTPNISMFPSPLCTHTHTHTDTQTHRHTHTHTHTSTVPSAWKFSLCQISVILHCLAQSYYLPPCHSLFVLFCCTSTHNFSLFLICVARILFSVCVCPYCDIWGILILWLGIKPIPSALEAWVLNHWTNREAPTMSFLKLHGISSNVRIIYLTLPSYGACAFLIFHCYNMIMSILINKFFCASLIIFFG